MSAIMRELEKSTGLKRKDSETDDHYIKALARRVGNFTDDQFDELSSEAQDYVNEVIDAINDKKAAPPLPDAGAGAGADEYEDPDEDEADGDDEEEDEDEAEDGDEDPDEDEDEADGDDEEEDPKPARRSRARKPKGDKPPRKKSKKKEDDATSSPRRRRSRKSDDEAAEAKPAKKARRERASSTTVEEPKRGKGKAKGKGGRAAPSEINAATRIQQMMLEKGIDTRASEIETALRAEGFEIGEHLIRARAYSFRAACRVLDQEGYFDGGKRPKGM